MKLTSAKVVVKHATMHTRGEFMQKATRLIIEEGNNIVFIKRTKKVNGGIKTFYVLPGGMLDDGEDWEKAGIREAKEELNVEVKIDELLLEEYNEELDKQERFYFATVLKGKVSNGNGDEFQNMSIDSPYGLYEVTKISKKELGAYNILPITIKDKLVATYI